MVKIVPAFNPTVEMVKSGSPIFFPVFPAEVRVRDFKRVEKLFAVLKKCGKQAYQSTIIAFDYDDDARELYEIPEVCRYIERMFADCPQLFYYVILADMALPYCLMGRRVTSRTATSVQSEPLDMDYAKAVFGRMRDGILEHGAKVGDAERAQQLVRKMGI